MIPKIIHYCWFGRNPLPESALKCIESWKKYLPDYEIKEWNEDNFDVNIIPYTAEAYKLKKYAFVSDYARFWILYKYGGLYFDTDVEVIKPMDDIIARGSFMGLEKEDLSVEKRNLINSGLGLGMRKGEIVLLDILKSYEKDHFVSWTGKMTQTVVYRVSQIVLPEYFPTDIEEPYSIKGVTIYPTDYFCPFESYSNNLEITENSRTIHHYHASWTNKKIGTINRIKRRFFYIYVRCCGTKLKSINVNKLNY